MSTAAEIKRQEYQLSPAEYSRICQLVHQHTGIALSENKRELVYSRITRRLRKLNLDGFAQYLELLETGDAAEIEEFTNAITTNLTSFFREDHHFEHLAKEVLPALQRANAMTRRLRIWSAGCSTGEEPYSIAMVLHENLGLFPGWDVRILATDLDSQVLAHGAAGEYVDERLDKMRADRKRNYFHHKPNGRWQVSNAVRELITFKQLNLMHDWPMRGPFDVIFCRNVMIYFDKETQRRLVDRFADMLVDNGHLFIGHSESLFNVSDRFRLIGKTIYRKAR